MMLKELIIGLVIVAGLSAAMNPEDYDALYPTEYPDQPVDYYQPPPDSAYFTNEEPADAGSLVDQGAVDDPSVLSSVPEGNGLWIVDGLNYEHTVSLNVPTKSWANQEIVPSVGGDLVIYYEYPTGQIVTQHLGRVRPYHRYWAWFYGPFPGVYKVWYVIDGVYRSNYVWYYVREDWPWWYGGYTFTTYYYTLPVRYYYRPIVYEPIRWTYKYTWEWSSTGHTWHDGRRDWYHDGRHDGRHEFVTTIVDP